MESITIRVEDKLIKEMSNAMKQYYSTKTEFIREAIRNQIKQIKKEKAIYELKKYFGKAKTKTSYKEERNIREKVGEELAKKFRIKLKGSLKGKSKMSEKKAGELAIKSVAKKLGINLN